MQKIVENVYIDDQYPGVTLGALSLHHGLIQIDAPPSPDDGRSWRAALLNLGAGVERLLINLDAHPDRTLGARGMDSAVAAHDKIAQAFRNRPNTLKALGEDTGAEWEGIPGIGTIRWATPEITFSHKMLIHWNEIPVIMQYQPGPNIGSIWVILPEQKIVFVGDAVIKNQPPFLAHANLPAWIKTIETLQSKEYRGYTVISGRGGPVSDIIIRNQLEYLKKINGSLEKLIAKQAPAEATEKLIEPLLDEIRFAAALHTQFAQRLRFGLYHYYIRHHHPSNNKDED